MSGITFKFKGYALAWLVFIGIAIGFVIQLVVFLQLRTSFEGTGEIMRGILP